MECAGFGMFRMWDSRDVGCSGCEMWDVGCLPGCGMLIYKMPVQMVVHINRIKCRYWENKQLHCVIGKIRSYSNPSW